MILISAASFITLLALLFSSLIIYVKLSLSYWKKRGVPYLKPRIPFGNFRNPLRTKIGIGFYCKRFYDELKGMGKDFGGIYSYVVPVFVPIDPKIIKLVLVKEFSNFHDRGFYYNEKDQPVSASLLTVAGERWKKLRTKLTPTFTAIRMKNMFHLMLTCSHVLEEHIKQFAMDRIPVNIGDSLKRFSTDVIGSCAFGIECNSFEDTTFYYILEEIFLGMSNLFKQTFCSVLPNLARFLKIPLMPPKEVNFVVDSVKQTIQFRTEENIVRNDFLQLLLEMKNNGNLSMEEIYAQCIIFFLGGYETSASTLTFALFELARDKEVQEKLRKEMQDVIAKHDGIITYEAVQEIKYLQMVIDETLRIYPPIPILKRLCAKDFQIPNTGITLEKGTRILIPILGLHFDPEYFPGPEKFAPERFSEENIHKIVPYTYLPFGEGPRSCIGERFAKLQVKIGLISLIKKYRFSLSPQLKLPLTYFSGSTERQSILLDVEFVEK